MARQDQIGAYRTNIQAWDGVTVVRYFDTDVVVFSDREIILNSGKHYTVSTKMRMNQCSNQFDLGFHVYQKQRKWFVSYGGEAIPFGEDGKVILQR